MGMFSNSKSKMNEPERANWSRKSTNPDTLSHTRQPSKPQIVTTAHSLVDWFGPNGQFRNLLKI